MRKNLRLLLSTTMLIICSTIAAYAQTASIKGTVTDENSQFLPFATVQLKGTTLGAKTDLNGNFEIDNLKAGAYTVVVSVLSYTTYTTNVTLTDGQSVSVIAQLKKDAAQLDQVVVVGYGSQKKTDFTGSVTAISSKDFNVGNVQSPEELIEGKVAGVQVTPPGGSPGSGATIRIRGNSSAFESNSPLYVIDGVPIEVDLGIAGSPNPLSTINPDDIETFTILKDASAAAIYGSRAAAGVIIITTKKGKASKKLHVGFSTNDAVSQVQKYVDVLSASQFRQQVNEYGNTAQKNLMGTASTNWQKEIYRVALGTDDNINFSGGIKNLPYRLSLGYSNQEGLLKTDDMERGTVDLNIDPTFFNNTLTIDGNIKGTVTQQRFGNQSAISSAVFFDPTQSVNWSKSNANYGRFGNYFEWLVSGGASKPGIPYSLAAKNPVGQINQKTDMSNVFRSIGNLNINYAIPYVKGLSATANGGYDVSQGQGTTRITDSAASNYSPNINTTGYYNKYLNFNSNNVLDLYLGYKKAIKQIKSTFDATAGYSYQDFYAYSPNYYSYYGNGDTIKGSKGVFPSKNEHTLVSFYGRLNYVFDERYLLTGTVREDGSSRFAPADRWGTFYQYAAAWRAKQESFLKNSKTVSDLKLRLGYGLTGNENVNSDYPYQSQYTLSNNTADYEFGNTFYPTLRPAAVDPNIHWETTTTTNIGLDYGFLNQRIYGAIDIYDKKTTGLISNEPLPDGVNFNTSVTTNIGNMENKGVEIMINVVPIAKKNMNLNIGLNFSYNKNEITKLDNTKVDSSQFFVGGISGGTGTTIQIIKSGHPIDAFYVIAQKYDSKGNPITGSYLTTLTNRYISSKPSTPPYYAGFNAQYSYKKWNASFVFRGAFGGYMYNNVESAGTQNTLLPSNNNVLSNVPTNYLSTKFVTPYYYSDYYLQNASFVKLDNVTVGYNVGKVFNGRAKFRISASVQNVLTITKYKGVDPEIYGGIDNTIYPRPRIYSLILNLQI